MMDWKPYLNQQVKNSYFPLLPSLVLSAAFLGIAAMQLIKSH